MDQIQKALDTVTGANANREDLTNLITITDGPQRPISQMAPATVAKNTLHQWREQGLNTAGRNNVAGGGATYAQGATPNTNTKAMVRKSNVTCNVGRTAQVTDNEMAAFNGGGSVQLAEGEVERLIEDALDFEVALASVEVLNQIEWMHVSGDSANVTMEGGETDGLVKWITSGGGQVVATGGTTGTPVVFTETFVKDGARQVAISFPTVQPDTLLVPPELIPDFAGFVQNGASRPIVQIADGKNDGFVAGNAVTGYNTAFSFLNIRVEPYLSPTYNTSIVNPAVIAYNSKMVKHASLVPLSAEPLARIDTSVKRMVTNVFAQEHTTAKHTFIISNVKSAIT